MGILMMTRKWEENKGVNVLGPPEQINTIKYKNFLNQNITKIVIADRNISRKQLNFFLSFLIRMASHYRAFLKFQN